MQCISHAPSGAGALSGFQKAVLIGTASLFIASEVCAQGLPPPPVSPTPVTRYEYDAQGNRTKIIRDPGGLNLETKFSYDSLYRVKEHTDPMNGKTSFEHDGGDRTTKVTDPRGLVTRYPRDGFGNATQVISPDTGTANQTYNEIGNITTRTDSRGVLETYTYDAMDRLTQLVYSKTGQPSQTVNWAFDLKGPDYSYSANRLSRTDHPNGWSRFKYDQRGRVLEAVQSVNPAAGANSAAIVTTTRYGYTLGRLTSITYPSGRTVMRSYTSRNVTGIGLAQDANGTPAVLLTDIQREPFGPVNRWNWNMAGGTLAHERFFDLSGRVTRYRLGNVFRDVTYDAADRIISFTHLSANDGIPQPALDQSFAYDENDRITQVTAAASSWSITYDPNGNRTNLSLNGSPSVYNVETTSNRLESITNPARSFGYDNAGNTTSDNPNYTATYSLGGSLASITKAGITGTYTYDADKRRIRKATSTGTSSAIIFVYGLNGELLGEYDQTGHALREYIWLDDIPVAMFMPDPATPSGPPLVFYIHADHLNTPRLIVDMNNAPRWRWLAEPFGTSAPEVNPSGLGAFTQNLRFPGQYADTESGLFYNYFRSYDSSTGSYRQSDPIGLAGGLATYAYVAANPLQFIDPNGLVKHTSGQWIDCGKGCRIRIDYVLNERTSSVTRHLHWECKGREGECGEFGEKSHGGSWDDAPEFIRQCALKHGFKGQSIPGPASAAGAPMQGVPPMQSSTDNGSGSSNPFASPQVYDPVRERWVPSGTPGAPSAGPLPVSPGFLPIP